MLAGVRAAAPIVLGYVPIGLAFGVVAAEAGLTPLDTGLMSLLVFAGAAQFMAVGMLAAGASAWAVVSTTFLVNLRHLLLSAALAPRLRGWPPARLLPAAFWLTDEAFAVLSAPAGGADGAAGSAAQEGAGGALLPAYVLGLQATAYLAWVAATAAGAALRGLVPDVRAYGIDLTLPAMFAGLLALQLRDARGRRAALVGAGLTALLARAGLGQWAPLLGAALAAAWAAGTGARAGQPDAHPGRPDPASAGGGEGGVGCA